MPWIRASSWHEAHQVAARALSAGARLPAHVAVETYSVLTRLPPPHRVEPGIVSSFLKERFPGPPLTLPSQSYVHLVGVFAKAGVVGGATYDGLVAATAMEAGEELLTRDRRAMATYERLGVAHRFLE